MSRQVQTHVPTSVALVQLLNEAPRDHVSLAWLIGHLQKRSFGLLMLFLALLDLAPGIATFTGFLLAFPAVQMILGRDCPTLPRFLAARSISTRHIARWAARAIPLFKRMEKFIHPRWHTPFQATKRLVGLIVLLLTASIIWPFPFSNIIPTLVVMLLSFAYLEEDGVLLCISLAAALLSFSSPRPPSGHDKSDRRDREAMDGYLSSVARMVRTAAYHQSTAFSHIMVKICPLMRAAETSVLPNSGHPCGLQPCRDSD
jgi:hypothetical protein